MLEINIFIIKLYKLIYYFVFLSFSTSVKWNKLKYAINLNQKITMK